MAFQTRGFLLPGVSAGADLSTHQHKFVKFDVNGQIVLCGDGESCAGALENDPLQDSAATVVNTGVAKVEAGANLAAGDRVNSDAAGLAKVALSGEFILGTAMASASAGELCSVLIDRPGVEP